MVQSHVIQSYLDHQSILDAMTVVYNRSAQLTSGNDALYPEVILAAGLQFHELGSTVLDPADIYGLSVPSTKHILNMFLDVIDHNDILPKFQVKLPDPNDLDAVHDLAQQWADVLTA